MSYSQNEEEKYIVEFFAGRQGCLLDIGANDGMTFSNSRRLIELGWCADLIEPSTACYEKLYGLYGGDHRIALFNNAIGTKTGIMSFHESGTLLGNGDTSLVSSLQESEKKRWGAGMEWKENKVKVFEWLDFLWNYDLLDEWEFISIDAEGMDVEILKQINLTNTELLCIEHNSIPETKAEILKCCAGFGMTKILYENAENYLLCKER